MTALLRLLLVPIPMDPTGVPVTMDTRETEKQAAKHQVGNNIYYGC